jgi:hypothetical protein
MVRNGKFVWNPSPCIFRSFRDDNSECLFDYWSIYHFYFSGVVYNILHHYLNITKLRGTMVPFAMVTLLHIVEEYLGNTSKISLEGVVVDYIGPLLDPKIDPSLRGLDGDYIQNSIGDVLSGMIACALIILYWYRYKTLPYTYLYGMIVMIYLLMLKAPSLYPEP